MSTFTGSTSLNAAWRYKYLKNTLEIALRKAMVAEAICQVDRTDSKYIANPYSNSGTAIVQTIAGTYTVATLTITEDTLTVADEFVYAEHILGFEEVLSRFDLFSARVEELSYIVAYTIDKWVLNEMCDNGGTDYDTPVGGFTTAGNWTEILANLLSKVAGYAEAYKGIFLVLENTDLTGVIQSQMATGFNFADTALKNGFVSNQAGVDIYVVRTGTFVDASASTVSGTKTWLNSGLRIFGVKGVATYAAPRQIHVDEKQVTLFTGRELSVWGLCGFKLWTPKAALIVRITIK